MALRSAAALASGPRGLCRLFSTSPISSFIPPSIASTETPKREMAEPSTNLFVSGTFPVLEVGSCVDTCLKRNGRRKNYIFSFTAQEDCKHHFSWMGLSKRTTTEGLREAFSRFGEVVQARVVTDRVNGYSKGYGFVRYATLEGAAEGIKGMDGKFLDGWVIFAEYARPRPTTTPPENNTYSPYGNNMSNPYGRQ